MEAIYITLFAFLLSLYIVSQPTTDARTKATFILIVFILNAMFLQTSMIWMFVYVALGIISAMVVSYWATKNIVHFTDPARPEYPVPYWLPVFFIHGFLAVHVFYTYVLGKMDLED
jgi:hypothetical protein